MAERDEAKGGKIDKARAPAPIRRQHIIVGTQVPRNEFGGVYVDEEELKAAFDFFDVNKKGLLPFVPVAGLQTS